jgi:hypothetical protein
VEKEFLLSDFKKLLFSPKAFFENRFLKLSSKQIYSLSFLGIIIGLGLGGLLSFFLSRLLKADFSLHESSYESMLKNLELSSKNFSDLLNIQESYNLIVAVFSPLIAYMAPHILGGALFGLLWFLAKPQEISFTRTLEISALCLTASAWCVIPGFGPLIAMIAIMLNLSRALAVQYKITGFLKALAILSAVYLCFFLGSTSLQLLAIPLSQQKFF